MIGASHLSDVLQVWLCYQVRHKYTRNEVFVRSRASNHARLVVFCQGGSIAITIAAAETPLAIAELLPNFLRKDHLMFFLYSWFLVRKFLLHLIHD
jgi:hypothetical protein